MARLVRAVLASSLALTLGACSMLPQQKGASHPAAPVTTPEEVTLPENITPIPSEMPQEGVTPPAGARKSMVIWGSGVQIFVCAAGGSSCGPKWPCGSTAANSSAKAAASPLGPPMARA